MSKIQHKYFRKPHRNFVYGFEDILLINIEYYKNNLGDFANGYCVKLTF